MRKPRPPLAMSGAADMLGLCRLTTEIRETVDVLDVSVAKKEKLYARLSDLEGEINRDRTRYEAYAGLMIEACDDAGEAATRLEKVVRIVERIGAAIGIAKRAEDAQARLPAPAEQKRIEHQPKAKPPKSNGGNFDKQLDDEIPFRRFYGSTPRARSSS